MKRAVNAAIAANVAFKRRQVGPEEGSQQLRVEPLRPVSELLKEALAETPPREPGDFRKPDLVELTKLDPAIRLEFATRRRTTFLALCFILKPGHLCSGRPPKPSCVRIES